ncbi:MAG: lysophospholipid acyltransferase family protein [Bacteroidales bacterium]
MRAISKFILKLIGWKINIPLPEVAKCVICVAPHTSNWDFILGKLFYWAAGRDASFLIKKEWFFFPMNHIFDAMGGVPVERSKRTDLVTQMVEQFNNRENFHLAITPEATRQANPNWKRGFYFIAKRAGVPIQFAYIDYGKREMGIKDSFTPTEDEEADMKFIKCYFKQFTARHPENFKTGHE